MTESSYTVFFDNLAVRVSVFDRNDPFKDLDLNKFGGLIRSLREQKDLSLVALGKTSGISYGYLSQLELGKGTPSLEVLAKISKALGVKASALFAMLEA